MRTLKYALLGAIIRGNKSGYDLAQEFNEELSHAWYASHSQIYPELKRMEKEGLITSTVEDEEGTRAKKVYTITDKGIKDFKKWIVEDVEVISAIKDEFRLKMYYLDYIDSDEIVPKLFSQREKQMRRLQKFKKAFDLYEERPTDKSELGNYLVLEGSILRAQSYVDWLDICIDVLNVMK